MSRRTADFTEGSIPRHLLAFAIPMFMGNLLQAFYNMVDSFWTGRFLGAKALAAVSVGFPMIMGIIGLVMGLTMATTTLVSQYFGAKQMDKVHRTINNSLLLLVMMGTALSVLGVIFREDLLHIVRTPEEIMSMASAYLGVYLAGLMPTFLYNVSSAILRGLGDSRTPLRFLMWATILNFFLDPLFIFGFGPIPAMGVTGVALATVIAQSGSAILALVYLIRKSGLVKITGDWWRLDKEIMALTFKIGIPAGMQQMLMSLSNIFVARIVNRFGTTVVAARAVGTRWNQFAFMPATSIGMAVSALVGQNLGAGKHERVNEVIKWSLMMGLGITFVVTVIVFGFPAALMKVFTDDADVIATGVTFLRYTSLNYMAFSLSFGLGGVMRGAGETMIAFATSLVNIWLVRVPLAAYLSSKSEYGVIGVWIAMLISPYVGTSLQAIYYKSGRWKNSRIVRRGPAELESVAE